MPLLAQRSQMIKGSAIAAMKQKAEALKAGGLDPIYLVQGEPNFSTPANIRQAACRAMEDGKTRYTLAQGLPALREAIAQWELKHNGIPANPETDVVVTNGTYQALYLSLLVTLEPGEEVIIPEPFFGPYRNVVQLAGGVPVYVPCRRAGNRFVIPPGGLESAVSEKSKAILLNTPWNPTGTVMSREELLAVGAFAEAHDLFVIVDEIYNRLIFDGGRHVSVAALGDDLRRRTITVNGFSKSFAMTGWRLGYLIADREICGPATRLNHITGRCATSFVQYGGVEALTGPQDSVREMAAAYQRRRDLMLEGLQPIAGLRPVAPEGTFYMLVDHSGLGLTTAAFALFLLEEAGVVVTPGDYFGQLGEGYVRLSFCNTDENIRAALDRIARAVPKLARVHP